MENQSFPTDISEWTWETITSLRDLEHPENTRLEYKKHLEYPKNSDKSKKEWRQNVEREFTAFANASGGFLVFGMDDDVQIKSFHRPEHDIQQTVKQYHHNTTPTVKTETSVIPNPSPKVDRVVVAVHVHKADRKPVATSDSAFYARLDDQKHPMNREQIESRFVDADRRQQAIRQLEMELDKFLRAYKETFQDYDLIEAPPDYHLIDAEGLKEVLRENTHLYTREEISDTIQEIFSDLRDIESSKRYYNNLRIGEVYDPYPSREQKQKTTRKKLSEEVDALHNNIQKLMEQLENKELI